MRRSILLVAASLGLGAMAAPLTAQLSNLSDTRTADQKWARSMYIGNFAWIGLIQHAKDMGLTAEEAGVWLGDFAAPSWGAPDPLSPASFVEGMLMNYSLWDGFQFEIMEEAANEVRGRMNMPYAGFFGDSGEAWGVTLDEFVQFWTHGYEGTASHLGLDIEHRVDGEWIEFTVRAR
jgi:hypothetical protein